MHKYTVILLKSDLSQVEDTFYARNIDDLQREIAKNYNDVEDFTIIHVGEHENIFKLAASGKLQNKKEI